MPTFRGSFPFQCATSEKGREEAVSRAQAEQPGLETGERKILVPVDSLKTGLLMGCRRQCTRGGKNAVGGSLVHIWEEAVMNTGKDGGVCPASIQLCSGSKDRGQVLSPAGISPGCILNTTGWVA